MILTRATFIWFGAIMLLMLGTGRAAEAAAIEFTDSITGQLHKTAESAGVAAGNRINKQYDDFMSTQKQTLELDNKISGLHYDNELRITETRKTMKEIGTAQIRTLEESVTSAKRKYQPLFDSYTSLNRRITLARKLKDKNLNKLLQTQADIMKTAVSLARQDIRLKQNALSAAKKDKTTKTAKVRSVLNEINLQKTKIRAERSKISTTNKLLSTEWKNFKSAIKKRDADRTLDILGRLQVLSGQILTGKNNIYRQELKISGIIQKANAIMR